MDAVNQWMGDTMILQMLCDSDNVNEQEREVLQRWILAADKPDELILREKPDLSTDVLRENSDLSTGKPATPETVDLSTTPRRPLSWLRAMFCGILGHRWSVSSGNDWRCCRHCRKQQTRARNAVWPD